MVESSAAHSPSVSLLLSVFLCHISNEYTAPERVLKRPLMFIVAFFPSLPPPRSAICTLSGILKAADSHCYTSSQLQPKPASSIMSGLADVYMGLRLEALSARAWPCMELERGNGLGCCVVGSELCSPQSQRQQTAHIWPGPRMR